MVVVDLQQLAAFLPEHCFELVVLQLQLSKLLWVLLLDWLAFLLTKAVPDLDHSDSTAFLVLPRENLL